MSSTASLLADALRALYLSRKDLQELLHTYHNLELFKPPVVNGWFVPNYKSFLTGAIVLLPSGKGNSLCARRVSYLGRSNGRWEVRLEDGSVVSPDNVSEIAADDMDGPMLEAVLAEMHTTLREGSRQPIPLNQSLAVAERRLQLDNCAGAVRRLVAIQQEAQRLEGDLSWAYGSTARTSADGDGDGDDQDTSPRGSPTLTQMWDETVSLASQIALTLRKRLSWEEQQGLEEKLAGFCAAEEADAAALRAAAATTANGAEGSV